MRKNNLANERLGLIKKNNNGSLMKIIKYNNKNDIWVEFIESGHVKNAYYIQFQKGSIKSHYDKTVFGVGFIGEGKYVPYINRKMTPHYSTWAQMLKRCYDAYYKSIKPTYEDCKVVDEWHNFQNFAKWYDDNYYEIDNEKMNLDKDILIKGNKLYSPETCVFVPRNMNMLFIKSDASRGNLPIGVSYSKAQAKNLTNKCYGSKCNDGNGNGVHLGFYNSPTAAFVEYKKFKENLIKQMANEYENRIPVKLYNALLIYEVEITD